MVPLSAAPLIPHTLLSRTRSLRGRSTPRGAVAGNEAADSDRYSFGIESAEEDDERDEFDEVEDVDPVELERRPWDEDG